MSGHYAYTFSSDKIDPLTATVDWDAYGRKGMGAAMFYYTPAVHEAAFQLPAFVDRCESTPILLLRRLI